MNSIRDIIQARATRRLEHLRLELRQERISYEGLTELRSLIPFIEDSDTELLEAARQQGLNQEAAL